MPDPRVPPSQTGGMLPWWRRHGRLLAVLGTLILAAALHRPILHLSLEAYLRRAAAADGMVFQGRLSGDVFTRIALSDLDLHPAGEARHGLRSLHIQRASITYSLRRLVWHGPGECISSYELQGARLQMSARPRTPNPQAPNFLQLLTTLLAQPALYADAVRIEGLDLETEEDPVLRSIRGAELQALPDKTGALKIRSVELADGRTLSALHGQTLYNNRHLILKNLRITPELEVREFSFDASQRSLGRSRLSALVQCGGGSLQTEVFSERLPKGVKRGATRLRTEFAANRFPLSLLAAQLGIQTPPLPDIDWAEAHIDGDPERPASWEGQADLRLEQKAASGTPLALEIHTGLSHSALRIDSCTLQAGTAQISLQGAVTLPPRRESLDGLKGRLELQAACGDLSQLKAALASFPALNGLKGGLHASGSLELEDGLALLSLKADSKAAGLRNSAAQEGSVRITAGARLDSLGKKDAWLGTAQFDLSGVTLDSKGLGVQWDSVNGEARLQDGWLNIPALTAKQGSNRIGFQGAFPLSSGKEEPRWEVDASLSSLADLRLHSAGFAFSGALRGRISGEGRPGSLRGSVQLEGSGLRWGDFEVQTLSVQAAASKNELQIQRAALQWAGTETVDASGALLLSKPFAYRVEASFHLPKLERLQPLLQQLGLEHQISGALEADWKGAGNFTELTGSGQWKLRLQNTRWDAFQIAEVEGSGSYEPGSFTTQTVRLSTRNTKLATQIAWSDGSLHFKDIALEQWGHPVLGGYLTLPLTRDSEGTHWVEGARLGGQLHAENLDLATLLSGTGTQPPVNGVLQFSLVFSGTPANPSLAFNLKGRDLRATAYKEFGPVSLELKGGYQDGQFTTEASVDSPLGAPLTVQASLPVSVSDLVSKNMTASQLPASGRLQINHANLKPLKTFWKGIRQLEGQGSLEVNLKGTLQKPVWNARLALDCPVLHFSSDRAPALVDVRAAADLDGRELRLRSLRADAGGGTLEIQGRATFEDPHNPMLDFALSAREVLVQRTRDLLLRLDGELKLRGPWNRAVISGRAVATKSRIQRDLDVLPIAALQGNLPHAAQGNGKPWFTFQRPPFSDWKFDVDLATKGNERLAVRGNRLFGSAIGNLRFEGTGAAPTIHGSYQTNDLVAFLPFARLEVSRGQIWYSREFPFQPQLDFSAEAEVRNYRIRLYLSGPPESPQVSLSSVPPLGETDLLNLLTTGALPSDASEGSQVLAGRAASLLVQELSGKMFDSGGNGERFSALRRFDLDLGAVNSRTGHQETRLTYKLFDNVFVIGEVGANGDFAARMRYLIRFR